MLDTTNEPRDEKGRWTGSGFTNAPKTGLTWEHLGYEGNQAEIAQRRHGHPTHADWVHKQVADAYKENRYKPEKGVSAEVSFAQNQKAVQVAISTKLHPFKLSDEDSAKIHAFSYGNKDVIGMDVHEFASKTIMSRLAGKLNVKKDDSFEHMDTLTINNPDSFAGQLLQKADVSKEPRDEKGRWVGGNSDTANKKWAFSDSKKIGTVTEPRTAGWKKEPSNFTKAAQAAAFYAKRDGKPMMVVSGNSYGHKVFHIGGAEEDGPGQAAHHGDTSSIAIVHTDGGVYQVTATKKASLKKFEHMGTLTIHDPDSFAAQLLQKADVSGEPRNAKGEWTKALSGTDLPKTTLHEGLKDPNVWNSMGVDDAGDSRYWTKHDSTGNHYHIEQGAEGRYEVKRILPVEGAGPIGKGGSIFEARRIAEEHAVSYEAFSKEVDRHMKALGAEKIKVVHSENAYQFQLAGQTASAGATYNPATNTITVYPSMRSPHLQGKPLEGLLAHEVMHHKWDIALAQYKKEEQAALDADHMRASGEIEEEHKAKYPAYVSMHPALNDFEKLKAEDGVTDYSKAWWNDWSNGTMTNFGNGIYHPINETLAEMQRLGRETGIMPGTDIWRSLHLAVTKTYLRHTNNL